MRDPKAEKQLVLDLIAEVTGVWQTSDASALQRLDRLHVWSNSYVESRLLWRPKVPLTIIELRCSRLASPLRLQNTPELWGCFSFANAGQISEEDWQQAIPVLPEKSFKQLQNNLREAFASSGVIESGL